jgi:hypothetical protein
MNNQLEKLHTLEQLNQLAPEIKLAVFDLFLEFIKDDVTHPDSPLQLHAEATGRLNDLSAAMKIVVDKKIARP